MRALALRETDVARAVVGWLAAQNWDIYQEVQFDFGSHIADIVAVRHGIVWIVESKTAYGFAVLEQATRWAVHYRSVAVPWSQKPRDFRVARDYYGVGVIEVGPDHSDEGGYHVREVMDAPLFRRNHGQAKRYMDGLLELHKTFAEAGSKGGKHLTPYKLTMMEVRKFVESHAGCTVKDLYEALGEMHYSSAASFKGNIIDALVHFERDWCRVDDKARPYRLYSRNGG